MGTKRCCFLGSALSADFLASLDPHDLPKRQVLLSPFTDGETEAQRGGRARGHVASSWPTCTSQALYSARVSTTPCLLSGTQPTPALDH